MQKEINISPQDFVIISVANLVKVKGIEILLNAVKLLNNPKIKVLIVGNDTDYSKAIQHWKISVADVLGRCDNE